MRKKNWLYSLASPEPNPAQLHRFGLWLAYVFFFWGGGGLYFFLLLLFVFISPPLPLSSPRHRTCTYTPPALPQTPPALPLWLLPHCMHGGQWGGGCILIAGGLTSPPPTPPSPWEGQAGAACSQRRPSHRLPPPSSSSFLLGFLFGGGFVLIILLLPSQIKTHPASSVSHLVAGQQWGALAVGSFITCSVGFFFWGGGSVVWDFPHRPYKHLAAPRWFLAPPSPAAPPPQGCWGGALILKLAGLGAGSGCVPTLPPPCVPVGSQH